MVFPLLDVSLRHIMDNPVSPSGDVTQISRGIDPPVRGRINRLSHIPGQVRWLKMNPSLFVRRTNKTQRAKQPPRPLLEYMDDRVLLRGGQRFTAERQHKTPQDALIRRLYHAHGSGTQQTQYHPRLLQATYITRA